MELADAKFFYSRTRPFFLLLRFLSTMRKNFGRQSGTLNHHVLVAFGLCTVGVLLAVVGFGATPRGTAQTNAFNSPTSLTAASASAVQPFAGGGVGDGAPATSVILSQPMGLARTTDGQLLI